MYDEEYDNDFGMSDEELLYREMNAEDPWYMGPDDDLDDEEFDVDDFDDEEFYDDLEDEEFPQ